jgi:hypothetical protein
VSLAAILGCALGAQQLAVRPVPAVVGQPAVVVAKRDGAPLPALPITVELPDGRTLPGGVTDAAGELRFVPRQGGRHVIAASIDGVRTVWPLPVVAARARWPLAIGAVPLGLALLWWHARRWRRGG